MGVNGAVKASLRSLVQSQIEVNRYHFQAFPLTMVRVSVPILYIDVATFPHLSYFMFPSSNKKLM